jgi:hypothetical protein
MVSPSSTGEQADNRGRGSRYLDHGDPAVDEAGQIDHGNRDHAENGESQPDSGGKQALLQVGRPAAVVREQNTDRGRGQREDEQPLFMPCGDGEAAGDDGADDHDGAQDSDGQVVPVPGGHMPATRNTVARLDDIPHCRDHRAVERGELGRPWRVVVDLIEQGGQCALSVMEFSEYGQVVHALPPGAARYRRHERRRMNSRTANQGSGAH